MSTQFSSTQPLLSVQDVAKLFSVTGQTVARWIKTGELRSFKLGGCVRFRTEDIDAFVAANERKRAAVAATH
jgi:excisionase family DNA binding protein